MSGWRYLKIGVSLATIFAAGLVIGGLLMLGWVKRESDARRNPQNWTPRTLVWLQKELTLTPAQVETLRPKIDAAMGELAALQERGRVESGRIAYRMLDAVAPVLTPEQQQRFTALRQKRTEAWLKHDIGN